MTILSDRPGAGGAGAATEALPARKRRIGTIVVNWLTTTDHKVIGHLYLMTSFGFFIIGGIMALIMRSELAQPGMQVLGAQKGEEIFNQLFTMHGTIMLLLFATPLFVGFANVIMPLQIGSPDVAFPRLNMFSYWLFLFGGLIVLSGFLTPGGAADFGWTAYTPLSDGVRSPGVGGDLWVMGLYLAGLGTILGGVNFVTTIFCMRAPGMTMFRMPIFTWNVLVTSILVLVAFPILAGALLMLEADRRLGAHIFDPANGGALLWQHLFWFFGHPEVYIIALPFFGIITEILPVFSRKPLFGYTGMVLATLSIAALSLAVWAHHMFVTGSVNLPFFSFMTFLIAVPTGVKFFNWIGTMWRGSLTFETPMLWSIGFLVTFLFGGLTGIILASPPLDFHVSDTYFVVAHFHYVVFGTVVFAMFAGFYFWWPKMTGRMLDETLGKIHFWTLFIGFHTTFLIQHWLGAEGMPRRIADYQVEDGYTTLNTVSTIGAFLLGMSTLPFILNVVRSWRTPKVEVDDPWGWGRSLEWATSSPPPRHNFTSMPRIRSESPAFDLRHPEIALLELEDAAQPDIDVPDRAGKREVAQENLAEKEDRS
ncbi:aa3-type cytochrome oxidase subunit I [Tenggerimyces flavus]|uniref:Cytochrome c oxidase subunit 1 n=1 Tax=Tenggerimyces flavus TaxID=1708749 RepID=A0ABV7YPV7_9ACTN|nr:cytochrome c oxidase subunit I [Tenggerimyces flavus]MBM7788738.1 cytochrome c oxidase subunit 1 [Tenggerimyces flavus]